MTIYLMAFFRFSTLSNSNASIQSAINSKENYDVLLLRKTVKICATVMEQIYLFEGKKVRKG